MLNEKYTQKDKNNIISAMRFAQEQKLNINQFNPQITIDNDLIISLIEDTISEIDNQYT